MMIGMTVAILVLLAGRLTFGGGFPRMSQAEYFSQTRLPFITNFRSSIMILTMQCILAVDFSGFPRSWAKTESFGTSLMDVGVGCIVFSSGLVSASTFAGGVSPSFVASIKSSLSMLVLGLIRLGMVKMIGYQEHVSEYGVHWNFFLTLASLPLLSNIVSRFIGIRKFISTGVIIGLLYELALRFTGLQTFILEGHRDNLVAMNKEGLSSLIGCLSLFLISCGFGNMIQNVRLAKVKNRIKLMIIKLVVFCIGSWAIYFALTRYTDLSPSRRMMNLAFVLWSSAVNSTHILFFFILDTTFMCQQGQSAIMTSVNDNQLLIFLLANLGTGLVNICFQTLLLSKPVSLVILSTYSLALCFIGFLMKRNGIVLRLK